MIEALYLYVDFIFLPISKLIYEYNLRIVYTNYIYMLVSFLITTACLLMIEFWYIYTLYFITFIHKFIMFQLFRPKLNFSSIEEIVK